MQKAADAAAMAGASALVYGGEVTVAARNDAAANGFTHGNKGIVVTVNNPPLNGPFTGLAPYVEVIVAQAQPTFFMRVLGSQFYGVNVSSRAVATSLASSSGCIFALDPSDSATLRAEGAVGINSACGIRVNSTSESGLQVGGGNVSVSQGGIGVVADGYQHGGGTISPTPTTGIPPFGDPLAGVPAPPVDGNCNQKLLVTTPRSIPYGTYCGGIEIKTSGEVTFQAGTFVLLGGGLTVDSGYYPTMTGSNVTFYNTGNAGNPYGPIKLTASGSTVLSAPTSGPLSGILFFQDRSIVSTATSYFDASRGEQYTGALYFPTTPVKYRGTKTFPPYTIIDAWTITMVDTAAINNNYSSLAGGASPIHSALLVE
jgi:hypothetical protein